MCTYIFALRPNGECQSVVEWSGNGLNVRTEPGCGIICLYIRSIRVHVVAGAGESWVRHYSTRKQMKIMTSQGMN